MSQSPAAKNNDLASVQKDNSSQPDIAALSWESASIHLREALKWQEDNSYSADAELDSADTELDSAEGEYDNAETELDSSKVVHEDKSEFHHEPLEGFFEPGQPKKQLRIVFGGMDGRFSTVPLRELARFHKIAGIIHTAPKREKQGLIASWASAGKHSGNLEKFAYYYKCPFFEAGSAYTVELIKFLQYIKPDLICLSNFAIILPPQIYEIPKFGSINLHLSALPQYRGANPWLWMFFHGDSAGGATVHRLDDGEDTGPVLGRLKYDVPANITASELADDVLPKAGRLLAKVVNEIADGAEREERQIADGELVRARRVRKNEAIIDWDVWEASELGAFLRGAYIWYDPLPPITGFYREYLAGVIEPHKEKPGTSKAKGFKGKLFCRNGYVPYKIRISAYEMKRIVWPIVICVLIILLLT